jgi:peptidoglycan hydrolase CwlO-like protein
LIAIKESKTRSIREEKNKLMKEINAIDAKIFEIYRENREKRLENSKILLKNYLLRNNLSI